MTPIAKIRSPGAAMVRNAGAVFLQHRRRAACYWLAIRTRSATHIADCVFTQSRASKPSLNSWTCSIVPSGHSASTCQCSPSFRTTQNIGVRTGTLSLMMDGSSRYVWRTSLKDETGDQPVALPNLDGVSDNQFLSLANGNFIALKRQVYSRDDCLPVLFKIINSIFWHAYTLGYLIPQQAKARPKSLAARPPMLGRTIRSAFPQRVMSQFFHIGCSCGHRQRGWQGEAAMRLKSACSPAPFNRRALLSATAMNRQKHAGEQIRASSLIHIPNEQSEPL
jgi:hypothetical protein